MVFDVDKIKAYYEELVAKRAEAIQVALLDKDDKVAQRFEEVREAIAEQVEKEIVDEAGQPYDHDIALCEKFIVEEEVTEEEALEEVTE